LHLPFSSTNFDHIQLMMRFLTFLIITFMVHPPSFKQNQLSKPRVKTAYDEKEKIVKGYFSTNGLAYEGFQLFIRAFKKERKLEAWVREKGSDSYQLLQTYPFCSSSGSVGPKRKEGDLQIPEGIYHLNHFNPESNFYLSLGVSYPNASDRILSDKKKPGGAIYIHGNCVTVGCIPITDEKIKELYVLAVEATNNGQQKIPVHIFPSSLDEASLLQLTSEFGDLHKAFWTNLKPIYENFEKTKKLKNVTVDANGSYLEQEGD
jgi:murein L,D-transpeptidase YafK